MTVLGACEEITSSTGPVDTSVPSAGAEISFGEIAANSVTVSWGFGTDEETDGRGLSYKLVRASEASDIDTIEEIDAIAGGSGLVRDYTRGLVSTKVAGLEPGTSYAFAVVVSDNTGHKALYAPALVTTLDVEAPQPGHEIGYLDIGPTSLTMKWGAASDDASPAPALEYKIVTATLNSAIDTLAEVDAITTAPGLVQDFTAGITSKALTGLSSSRAYSFAVVVRDGQGNEALYAPVSVVTPDMTPPTVGTGIGFSNVEAHAVTVGWGHASDSGTGQPALKYKLVKARNAAAIDTLAEVDAIIGGDALVKEFAAAVTSVNVSGLSSSSSYAFAVVVKDIAGNRALYAPASITTLDVSAPRLGAGISVSNVSSTGMNLSWGAASDELTPENALQYKLVKASSATAIDTLEEVALITGGDALVQDFSAGLVSEAVSGLTSSTSYAFNVVVKDQQGNQAIYSPLTQSTLDVTAPVPGSALNFANLAATSLTVNWSKASDDVSAQAALQYKLVASTQASNIDTIAKVDAISSGSSLVMDFTSDVATRNVSGLASATTYSFALLVRDAAGNKVLYAPASATTLDVSAPSVGAAISATSATDTTINLAWGAASDDGTPSAALEYKVVTGANLAAIDSLAEIDAITAAPGLLADYSANLTSAVATGLNPSTTYAFAVVVRDATGNRALYTPRLLATRDVTPPTTGSAISFNGVTDSTLNIDWGRANDDVTDQADLQYKVVKASQTSAIDSLSEVAAITSGPELVQDFTADITTLALAGLDPSTTYAFAVVVRDLAGNEALYAPGVVSTIDSAPTPGTVIDISGVTSTDVMVSWGAASDDVTSVASLEYKLVMAADATEIDTLAKADAIVGAGLVQDFTANLTSLPLTGLSPATDYAFAVVVRDATGNKALYAPATTTTAP